MRLLLAIAPMMYRQTLAHVLKEHRPDIQVKTIDPSDLDREVTQFKPDLIVSHEISEEVRKGVHSSVEILYSDSLDAQVYVNDINMRRLDDIKIEDLLATLDEVERSNLPA